MSVSILRVSLGKFDNDVFPLIRRRREEELVIFEAALIRKVNFGSLVCSEVTFVGEGQLLYILAFHLRGFCIVQTELLDGLSISAKGTSDLKADPVLI